MHEAEVDEILQQVKALRGRNVPVPVRDTKWEINILRSPPFVFIKGTGATCSP